MKARYLLFSIAFIFVFYNCSDKSSKEKKSVEIISLDLDKGQSIASSLFIDSIRYVKLETKDDILISEIKKISFDGTNLYILDKLSHIFVYDMDGRLNYVIDKTGQGPGEYVNCNNIAIKDETIEVLDLRSYKVLHYNKTNGAYIKSFQLNKFVYCIFPIDNNCYLGNLPADLGEDKKFGIYLLDSDYSEKEHLIPFSGKYPVVAQDAGVFSEIEKGKYGIYSQVENAIYHYQYPVLEKKYEFQFKGKVKLEEKQDMSMAEVSSDIVYLLHYKETNRFIVLFLLNDMKLAIVAVDKSNHSTYHVSGLAGLFAVSDTKNILISQIPAAFMDELKKHPEYLDKTLAELVKNTESDDNPIIQLMYLKH